MLGGCACGQVRYSADIDSDDAYLCHCRMCQRATGSVSIAFVQIAPDHVRWLGEPAWYDSSPITRRPYCSACGTSLGFAYRDPARGSMDLTVASFDDPARFRPVEHFGSENLLEAWIDTSTLPRRPTESPTSVPDQRRADAGLPVRTERFLARDGVGLAWHELGEGRPVVLIHGLFSTATMNWIRFGHAARIAERGFRVIMPDLRAHGASDKPHDPAAYPPDVLVDDAKALIQHLALREFDLGGYSLGGRTVARLLIAGIAPRRAIIAGMGLEGLLDTEARATHFRAVVDGFGSFTKGSPQYLVQAFLKTTGGDPVALRLLLDTFTNSLVPELEAIGSETLIVQGDEDDENGSAHSLRSLLAKARFVSVPGGHMSCITKPEFGQAIADFLSH